MLLEGARSSQKQPEAARGSQKQPEARNPGDLATQRPSSPGTQGNLGSSGTQEPKRQQPSNPEPKHACINFCMHACLHTHPTHIHNCLPAHLPTCTPPHTHAQLPACTFANLHAPPHTCATACLHTSQPDRQIAFGFYAREGVYRYMVSIIFKQH